MAQAVVRKTTRMSFDQFESEVSDASMVVGRQKILRHRDIRAHNLTPEQVVSLLDCNVVVQLRPSWRNEIPRLILLIIATLIALNLTLSLPSSIIGIVPMFSFLPLAVLGVILHKRFNKKYLISDTQISSVTGLIAWRYLRIRMEYEYVRAVEVEKNLIGRILNTGNIRTSTILFDQAELIWSRLHNPEFYATVIRLKQQLIQRPDKRDREKTFERASLVEEGR